MTSPSNTRRVRTILWQKGKKTVADTLSRISEEWFSDEEAEKVLKAVPVIPGDDTIFEVFEENEEDQWPEKAAPMLCLLRP